MYNDYINDTQEDGCAFDLGCNFGNYIHADNFESGAYYTCEEIEIIYNLKPSKDVDDLNDGYQNLFVFKSLKKYQTIPYKLATSVPYLISYAKRKKSNLLNQIVYISNKINHL